MAKKTTKPSGPVTHPAVAQFSGELAQKLLEPFGGSVSWAVNPNTGRIDGSGLQLGHTGTGAELNLAAGAPTLARDLIQLAKDYQRVCALLASKGVSLGEA